MWWSDVGEEEAFYNPVIRSQPSVSLSPWAVTFTGAFDSSLHPTHPTTHLCQTRRLKGVELGVSLPLGQLVKPW